jgi:hypothetical protein
MAYRGFMHTDARLLSTENFNIEDGFILPEDLKIGWNFQALNVSRKSCSVP